LKRLSARCPGSVTAIVVVAAIMLIDGSLA
jgi:hypothetical protein